jgi:serine/threonine-protein kinase
MAPEQARDSRATSISSDIYSLGCTLYFLLTASPPFPGGYITDKLTHHAKTPAPDVRDLRIDVPRRLAEIVLRMMAKRPEDRFRTYDDLIRALRDVLQVPAGSTAELGVIPFAGDSALPERPASSNGVIPFADEVDDPPAPARATASAAFLADDESDGVGFVWEPPNFLIDDPEDDGAESFPSGSTPERDVRQVLPRLSSLRIVDDTPEPEADSTDIEEPAEPSLTRRLADTSRWVIIRTLLAILGVGLLIGSLVLIGQWSNPGGRVPDRSDPAEGDKFAVERTVGIAPTVGRRPAFREARERAPASHVVRPEPEPPPQWVEPADPPVSRPDIAPETAAPEILSRYLPDWGLLPIPDRVDGRTVIAERATDRGDATTFMSLKQALEVIGGTIEIADEGPFFLDDTRIAGDTRARLIRARPGLRSILQVERSAYEVVRNQPAVFLLVNKNVILQDLDIVVDVRSLTPRNVALFQVSGGSLTLKNCSITVCNSLKSQFACVVAQSQPGRPARLRIEQSLIRGEFTSGIELGGENADLVMRDSMIIGGEAPLIHADDIDGSSLAHVYLFRDILAGRGPIIELTRLPLNRKDRPSIAAYGSVFARFGGSGIASVLLSRTSLPADQLVDWRGDHNTFAGWKGFLTRALSPRDEIKDEIIVRDLGAARSTWNGTDPSSRESLPTWLLQPGELRYATSQTIAPFVSQHKAILEHVVEPRPALFEKTLAAFPSPVVPAPNLTPNGIGSQPNAKPGAAAPIIFDTAAKPWNGDLGAFIKERADSGPSELSIIVQGSGTHRFSPVRLSGPFRLYVHVRTQPGVDPPVWMPAPDVTGDALLDIQGGSLVLSNVWLRADDQTLVQRLVRVEDGHLILNRCRFTTANFALDPGTELVSFKAAGTREDVAAADAGLFLPRADRPTCRVIDSILITGGTALRAEQGRGLVAFSQTAIAAGDAAFDLLPSRVSRTRFQNDLSLDHCTIVARSMVRLGPWPGHPLGPDRPWLVSSANTAFLSISGRKSKDSSMLRVDQDAFCRGTLFWQGMEDGIDVDQPILAGTEPPQPGRGRDMLVAWARLWGSNHTRAVVTWRGLNLRFRNRPQAGTFEPADLLLDPRASVGADLSRQGITIKP